MSGEQSVVRRIADDLEKIRAERPLIHHITNYVVMNETANATLCLGALPVMAHAQEEVAEMTSAARALVLNIGTLDRYLIESMKTAGRRANELGVPVILDPVGAGATALRTEAARQLLEELDIAVIRGNAAEVGALTGRTGEIRGVESISTAVPVEELACEAALAHRAVVAVTGAQDVVTDGERIACVENGHAMLGQVTGTGCMATTAVAAFCAVEADRFVAAVGGLVAFGLAGEAAARTGDGKPGTFHAALYDALAGLHRETVLGRSLVEMR